MFTIQEPETLNQKVVRIQGWTEWASVMFCMFFYDRYITYETKNYDTGLEEVQKLSHSGVCFEAGQL